MVNSEFSMFFSGSRQEDDCAVQVGERAAVQAIPLRLRAAGAQVSPGHGW